MKSALKLFIIGCLVLIFCQCSMNKDSYLKDFEKFITQTEKNCTTLSDPEWEKIQARSTIIQKNITNSLKRN